MKRILSLLLALTLAFSVFSACSEKTENAETAANEPTASDPSAASTPEEEEETEPELVDLIPERDFEGYAFNYLAIETGINGTTRFVDEMWVESETGDVINDAVWRRNVLLEDRLNFKIGVTPSPEGSMAGRVKQAVTAGDDAYDLCGAYKSTSMSCATEGLLLDWNCMGIDFSNPWWSQGAVEKLKIGKYQFLMSGNILISEIDDTLAMTYNKGIVTDYGLEDIYSVVKEGRWTIDKFIEMTSAVSNDLNGDGEMKVGEDLFGYVQDPASMTNNWFFSCDLMNDGVGEDGVFDFNIDAERVQGMLDKLAPYFQTDNIFSGLDLYVGLTYFQENQIFVYAIILRNVELLREMEVDFGVIPYPMYDEAQGRYITHVGSASPILSIPLIHTENNERAAAILDAMAMASRQYMLPAYYESALKEKLARDPETAEMLDIITDCKTYDLSYLIGNGLISTAASMVTQGSTDFASKWAKMSKSNSKVMQKTIDKLFAAGEKQG